MKIVNDMLEVLLDLKEKGYGNLPLIYSTDEVEKIIPEIHKHPRIGNGGKP